jgi:hypothetical protein
MRPTLASESTSAAIVLVGIFGSIWDLDDKIVNALPFIEPYFEFIEVLFIAALALAAIFSFYTLWKRVSDFVFDARHGGVAFFARGMQHYFCKPAKASDIQGILNIFDQNARKNDITPGSVSHSAAENLYKHSPKGWRIIVDRRTNVLSGYFVVMPLTNKGEAELVAGAFDATDESQIKLYAKNHRKNGIAYIGMVISAVEKSSAKGRTLYELTKFLNNQGYSKIYARASTRDGLRLVKRMNFEPVDKKIGFAIGGYFKKAV